VLGAWTARHLVVRIRSDPSGALSACGALEIELSRWWIDRPRGWRRSVASFWRPLEKQHAHALKLPVAHVDAWHKGRNRPQEGIWLDLLRLARERETALPPLKAAMVAASHVAGLRPKLIDLNGTHVVHDANYNEVFRGTYDEWGQWFLVRQTLAISEATAKVAELELSPEDRELMQLDRDAERARQNWLAASRHNAGQFASAYRGGENPKLEDLSKPVELEKICRKLHAPRLAAYAQRYSS
jgi:hypothetical protein